MISGAFFNNMSSNILNCRKNSKISLTNLEITGILNKYSRDTFYRGLVKWYDRSLQNFWWEFDSLIPCFEKP